MPRGEGVQVEQQFFGSIFRIMSAAMQRILLALFGASEIEVAAHPVRHGKIALQDAAEHFLVQRFLKWLGATQKGIGVSIFSVEISDHFGIILVA